MRNIKTIVANAIVVLMLLGGAGAALAAKVDINSADAATLASELKGVGEKKAQAIVAYRDEHGPFKSIQDLAGVKGIGDKVLQDNIDGITVDGK